MRDHYNKHRTSSEKLHRSNRSVSASSGVEWEILFLFLHVSVFFNSVSKYFTVTRAEMIRTNCTKTISNELGTLVYSVYLSIRIDRKRLSSATNSRDFKIINGKIVNGINVYVHTRPPKLSNNTFKTQKLQ